MRSIFLVLLVVSTTAAIKCYDGSSNLDRGLVDYGTKDCGDDVKHCNLVVPRLHNDNQLHLCGIPEEGCDKDGCRTGLKGTYCCCKHDLCNLKKPDSVRQMGGEVPIKTNENDMCLVGTAPLEGTTGVNIRKWWCPTQCRRNVKQGSDKQDFFQLSCATREDDCKNKPICKSDLAGARPVDCCCKGTSCNGLPWANLVIEDSITTSNPSGAFSGLQPADSQSDEEEKPRIKMTKNDMCMVGTAPVQGFNINKPTGVNMMTRRCRTMCMRTVRETSHYQKQFILSCAKSMDDCNGKDLCQDELSGLVPIDCCCKGKACNGRPWAGLGNDDSIHVKPPGAGREVPPHPRIIVDDEEPEEPEDINQISREGFPFTQFFMKLRQPGQFQSAIQIFFNYIAELIQSVIKHISGNQ